MPGVDREWIKDQLAKAVSAEESIVKAEKDHRNGLKQPELTGLYDRLIADDERHLEGLKQLASKYGYKSGGIMEGAGGVLGGLKSAVEGVGNAHPFQTIGDDLMLKSNAVNYDLAWTRIFREIGDEEGASAMDMAAREDEEHENMMRQTLTSVGLMSALGEDIEEE